MRHKGLAVAVIVGVLAVQGYVLLPGTPTYYWPFTDYPMYATAHHVGEAVQLQRLRAERCDGRVEDAPAHRLPMPRYRYWTMLHSITTGRPEAAAQRDSLEHVLHRMLGERPCRIVVVERRWVLEPDGYRIEAPEYEPVYAWRP